MIFENNKKDVFFKCQNLNKSFPGVQALKQVSIEINYNEIVGIIGENGAGKSTFFNLLSGIYKSDSGKMFYINKAYKPNSIKDAYKNGIGICFQELSLITNLTVSQNIFLGMEEDFISYGIINWSKMHKNATKILEKINCEVNPRLCVEDLKYSDRQLVQIAKVLFLSEQNGNKNCLILLDEPTSMLTKVEIKLLFEKMKEMKKEGISFIFVSHRMEEVLEISDRVYVFKNGEVQICKNREDININLLYKYMVGHYTKGNYYKENQQIGYNNSKVILKVNNLSKKKAFSDINFEVYESEIFGICGVQSSGKEALCEALAGISEVDSGNIIINGKKYLRLLRFKALNDGIGFIPKERRDEGLLGNMKLVQNISLTNERHFCKRGIIISNTLENICAEKWVKKLDIKTPDINVTVLKLSGGNQQKVIFARVLLGEHKLLILNHPTRGVDIGAKEEIYQIIRDCVINKMAIILLSDTLDESIGLCNRIMVMKDGHAMKIIEANKGDKPELVDI